MQTRIKLKKALPPRTSKNHFKIIYRRAAGSKPASRFTIAAPRPTSGVRSFFQASISPSKAESRLLRAFLRVDSG
jgi:hypothetical protein